MMGNILILLSTIARMTGRNPKGIFICWKGNTRKTDGKERFFEKIWMIMGVKKMDVKTYADFKKKNGHDSILILPVKCYWLYKIASGEKWEEYRDITPYYEKRMEKYMRFPFFYVGFRGGYNMDSPFIVCRCKLRKGEGFEKWGAEKGKKYYVLEIGKVYYDF